MKIIAAPANLAPPTGRVCAAIGMFDGVHLGHQQVIRQAITDAHQHEATSLCITFDCHPAIVLDPGRAPRLIQSLPQRLGAIEALGVEAALVLKFDESLSRVAAADFVRNLHHGLGRIHSLCVGARFTFGHHRQGNVDLLKELGAELGFTVHGLAAVALDGETVSSTRIRQAIADGRLDAASQMLGREYALAGMVIQGDQRGRDLGCPTANLACAESCTPPHGVYAARAQLGDSTHRAAVNIGQRPTVADPAPTLHVEAHLLDFGGDLYGQHLELTFIEKLRGEQKFDSLDALKDQIASDIQSVRELFATS